MEEAIPCKQKIDNWGTSDKIDFKTKNIKRHKRHFIILNGLIQGVDTTIIKIYSPNICAPKYIQEMLMDVKTKITGNSIIAGDFNTLLIAMDRKSRSPPQKKT